MIDYSKIPPHMMKAINEYVKHGKPLGGFLRAVFANDLRRAICKADEDNAPILKTYVAYVHWEIPDCCHGSYEAIDQWMKDRQEEAKHEDE